MFLKECVYYWGSGKSWFPKVLGKWGCEECVRIYVRGFAC